VCRCVWSRTALTGYYIAIIAGGQVNESLLTTCLCVQRKYLAICSCSRSFYIEMSHSVDEMKCRSQNGEHDFVGLKSHL